jgi:hypothetical protein
MKGKASCEFKGDTYSIDLSISLTKPAQINMVYKSKECGNFYSNVYFKCNCSTGSDYLSCVP